jgi:mannonate dehydratase
MKRRRFLAAAAATASTAAAAVSASRIHGSGTAAARSPRGRPVLGHQHQSSDPELKILSSLGVEHICSAVPSRRLDDGWSVAGLSRLRERVERHGIKLDMVPLPLGSTFTANAANPNIMRGKSPERDREIDGICQMIRNTARAGISALKYNLTLLGVVRTASTPGRGAARYSTFVYSQAKANDPSPPESGPASADQMWERIEYFLKRVVPVAAEYKVRLCCHPHDPGMPSDKGYRGIHRVLGSVDGLKKFVGIMPSPYHGLNFCQGTISEMLERPGQDIYDVIRWFGERDKIFNVHFRNIKGGFLSFQETFPDDGAVDMVRALRTYRDVGYSGMIMPDHVPAIEGDSRGAQAFAYSFGYIKALLQVISSEG